MAGQRVSIAIEDHVADVRLTRPEKLNALDPAMFAALTDAIAQLEATSGLRAAVLSGEGRGFCAGLDMASMASGGSGMDLATRTHGLANDFQQVAWGWRTLPVPVIAAVHGVAFGGGLQIASGADIRIVAPDARLSAMEMKWGIVPDMAGYALWRGNVRDDVLRELIYTAREFGAEATVNIEELKSPQERIARVREIVGGFGADLVMDCSGHPTAGPEGIEMLRDGGTYVEMGQFTDAGSIDTSWHRICTKDLNVLGSWGFTGNDLPLGVDMLYRTANKYPWLKMQTIYPFTEEGVAQAVKDAMAMKTVKSTIVPWPELVE